jgi:hypothetical protein
VRDFLKINLDFSHYVGDNQWGEVRRKPEPKCSTPLGGIDDGK